MPIVIAPGTEARVRRLGQSGQPIFLQARGVHESQQEELKHALDQAWDTMMGAFGEDYIHDVSPTIPTRDGPVISIDAPDAPRWVHEGIPDVFARSLDDAGVTEATVVALTGGYNGSLWKSFLKDAPSVTLRLYTVPPPPHVASFNAVELPQEWLDAAVEWLREGAGGAGAVRAAIQGVEFETDVDSVPALWRACWEARTISTIVVAGDLRRRIWGANPKFRGAVKNLAIGGRGPKVGDDELVSMAEDLADLARRFAPAVAQAFVTIDDIPSIASGYNTVPGGAPEVVERTCDEFVFDGFAWQILGPGHVARLGSLPPGARPLDGGRVEVAFGTWQDWLPTEPERRAAVQQQARSVLSPLLSLEEMRKVDRSR